MCIRDSSKAMDITELNLRVASATVYKGVINAPVEMCIRDSLYTLELYMEENKKGVFALAVFAAAFMNYFFFAGMVVFVMIYWLLRMLSGKWSITMPRFGWLLFEAVIGVALAAVLLLPSALTVLANPRTSSQLIGWDLSLIHIFTQRRHFKRIQ